MNWTATLQINHDAKLFLHHSENIDKASNTAAPLLQQVLCQSLLVHQPKAILNLYFNNAVDVCLQ